MLYVPVEEVRARGGGTVAKSKLSSNMCMWSFASVVVDGCCAFF